MRENTMRMNGMNVALMLLLSLCFTASARADFELIGSGWKVAGLTDTDPGTNAWTLAKYGVPVDDLNFVDTGYDSVKGMYTDGIDPKLGAFDAGDWIFSTTFTVAKIVDNPVTATAHIAFYLLTSQDVTQILVGGKPVTFEAKRDAERGWFEIILAGSEYFNRDEPINFNLDFVYSFSDENTVNQFAFGVAFDLEDSKLVPNETPEPATMLILGLGIAGLGIARRQFGR